MTGSIVTYNFITFKFYFIILVPFANEIIIKYFSVILHKQIKLCKVFNIVEQRQYLYNNKSHICAIK